MKYFLTLISMFILLSCSETTIPGFEIQGTLSDYPEGTAILKRRVGSDFLTIDSVAFSNGSFTLTGALEYPEMCYLWVSDTLPYMRFIVENSDITLSGTVEDIRNPTITGSKSNDLLIGYNELMKPYDQDLRETYKEYLAAEKEGDKDLAAVLEKKFDDISDTQKNKSLEFVKNNSNNVLSGYITWGTLIYE